MKLDPQIIVWELTLACNSNCFHCGSDAKKSREDELDTSEAIDLVGQISDLGFKRIVLSGGEPTLKKDWLDISSAIKKKDLELVILSNALSWNNSVIDNIVSLKPYTVGFSVDGRPKFHDELRGITGSHTKIFSVIKKLKQRGQYVSAITTVNKRNFNDLSRIRERLMVYGVDAWQIQVAFPMGRMPQSQLLNESEYYKLGEFILDSMNHEYRLKTRFGDCIGYFGELGSNLGLDWQGCWGGIKGLGIDSNGTIRGCLSLQTDNAVAGNIREKSLKEIWEKVTNFKYTRSFDTSQLGELCSPCEYGQVCRGGCQAQSYAHFDRFNNSPYCFLRHEKEAIAK